MLRRALPTVATIFCVCAARSAGVSDDRQLQLHDADNDAVRRFVETAESVHRSSSFPGPSAAYFAIDNSPGMSRAECLALEVAIMMPSVRM